MEQKRFLINLLSTLRLFTLCYFRIWPTMKRYQHFAATGSFFPAPLQDFLPLWKQVIRMVFWECTVSVLDSTDSPRWQKNSDMQIVFQVFQEMAKGILTVNTYRCAQQFSYSIVAESSMSFHTFQQYCTHFWSQKLKHVSIEE